jgi:hypothetical protein
MKDRQPSGVGIDVIATIVGLSAILLPAAGYLVRKVALETGFDIDNGTNVALAAPLGLLTITGVYAALSPGLYLLLLPVYHRLALVESAFRRTEPRVGELMSKHAPGKVVGRIVNGVLVCAWIGLSLFVLPWPIGVFSFLGWLAVGIVVPWRARRIGRVTPGIAAFSIGWVLLISAIGLGLAGSLPGQAVGDFRFAPAAGMSDGMYVWLGQDNQSAFISPCGTRRLVSVRPDAVEHVVWSRYRDVPQGPTLWEIISRGKQPRYGYRPNC